MPTKLLITLNTPNDAQTVRNSGAEVLAEYPSTMLVRAEDAQVAALRQAGLEIEELPQPPVQLLGASFDMVSARAAEAAAPMTIDANRIAYYVVQLAGPPMGAWLATIQQLGGNIQGTLPGYALLVGLLPANLPRLEGQPWVEAITPYRAAMKVSYQLRPGASRSLGAADLATLAMPAAEPEERLQVEISVFQGESTADVAAQVRAAGGLVLAETPRTVTAVAPPDALVALAEQPGVQSIIPHQFPEFSNNAAAGVMAAPPDRVFGDLTIGGAGQIVGIADSGLDNGNPATIHADFAGRIVNLVSWPNQLGFASNDPAPFDDGTRDENSGHGTHVAGSVLGNAGAAVAVGSTLLPQGLAPEARLYFQAIEQKVNWKTPAQLRAIGITPPSWWPPAAVGLYGLPNDLNDLFNQAYTAGARVHTNSWGADNAGLYNATSSQVDQFMWNHRDMVILYAASNAGVDADNNGVIDQDSIGTPATAKNCITVGASENNRPHGSTPPPGRDANWSALINPATGLPRYPALGPAGHLSDNPEGMAAFSSRGPTDDGRIKPDVVAPGVNILSTRTSAYIPTAGRPSPLWGDLPAAHELFNRYCWSGGTSMATPLAAGAATLVRQHLVQQRGHFQDGVKPSGALIKAILVNGAVPMAGQFPGEIPAGPNNVSGFGRINLTEALTPGALARTLFADEPDYAVESGQIRTFQVQPIETTRPLKITLVWSDAPGLVGSGGLVNQLYLQVRRPDGTLVNGDTTAFPTVTNNVQQVVINSPAAGTYEIRVRGVAVTQQSPGASAGTNPRQDFALAVANGMGLSLQPVSIAQAIDTTGSMDFFGYMAPAKERATQLVNFLRGNDKVAITEFSHRAGVTADARTPYPLRLLGGFMPDWSDAHAAIGSLHADGLTPIGAGLAEAWHQLQTEPTARPRAIVLLSDGFNNFPPDPMTTLATIPTDVPILTVALGPAADSTMLQNIANSRPNGGYYTVESDEDVHKLHSIYAQVQALAAGGGLVGLATATLASQAAADHALPIEPGVQEATFALSWDSSAGKLALTIIDPAGQPADASTAATLVRGGAGHQLVRVTVPKPGLWKLQVRNAESNQPVKYTLSGAVQSPMQLLLEPPKVGSRNLVVTARRIGRRIGGGIGRVARVAGSIVGRSVSRSQVLAEFGNEIKAIQLPEAVQEPGLDEEQVLSLKLATFAQRFVEKPGGLYQRTMDKFELTATGEEQWSGEIPLLAAGNVTIEVTIEGDIDGIPWTRVASQTVYIPESAVPEPKVKISEIFCRRNRFWQYAILGVRVVKADGSPATPTDGVSVQLTVTQGSHTMETKDLSYYRRGRYFIWRMNTQGWQAGPAEVKATVSHGGGVVAMARKQVQL